jgi:hypothetical protein
MRSRKLGIVTPWPELNRPPYREWFLPQSNLMHRHEHLSQSGCMRFVKGPPSQSVHKQAILRITGGLLQSDERSTVQYGQD